MRFYPRFVPREQADSYIRALAPEATLFSEFKERQRKLANHNSAFYLVKYEERFALTPAGIQELKKLSELSKTQDVTLICQCQDFERCHTDLLLLMARKYFQAPIQGPIFDYPDFTRRLTEAPEPENLLPRA